MFYAVLFSIVYLTQGQAAGFYIEPCSSFNEKISESLTQLTNCIDQTLQAGAGKLPKVYCESENHLYLMNVSDAEKCKLATKILPTKIK